MICLEICATRFDTTHIRLLSLISAGRRKKSETNNTSREANAAQLAATNPERYTHADVSVSRYQDSTNALAAIAS